MRAGSDLAAEDAAIARVLDAERKARAAIAATHAEVQAIAERARRAAAARTQCTEERCRHVAACFERHTAARVAEIEQRLSLFQQPHTLDAGEIERLSAAVAGLARDMVGAS